MCLDITNIFSMFFSLLQLFWPLLSLPHLWTMGASWSELLKLVVFENSLLSVVTRCSRLILYIACRRTDNHFDLCWRAQSIFTSISNVFGLSSTALFCVFYLTFFVYASSLHPLACVQFSWVFFSLFFPLFPIWKLYFIFLIFQCLPLILTYIFIKQV